MEYTKDEIDPKQFEQLVAAAKFYGLLNYHFTDLGCGAGRACMLAEQSRRFKSVTGIDNDAEMLREAIGNAIKGGHKIDYKHEDASDYILPRNMHNYVFLYSPFDEKVLGKFLENNKKNLINSIVAYANDIHSKTLKEFGLKCTFQSSWGLSLWVMK